MRSSSGALNHSGVAAAPTGRGSCDSEDTSLENKLDSPQVIGG
jgi:hypothetical protein